MRATLSRISDVIRAAKARKVKVILVANQISPMALHQLMRLGAEDFVPYPLPKARCTMPSNACASPNPNPSSSRHRRHPRLPRKAPPRPRSSPRVTARACFCLSTALPAAPAHRPSPPTFMGTGQRLTPSRRRASA